MHQALIIGGGHNGLVCAAYLARAGLKPLVLEARDCVGGFATTEATIDAAPGFLFSPTSLDIATGNIPPSVMEELDLARHGLRWVSPDPFYSYVDPDGSSLAFWRDYRKTCGEISAFSRADAERYAELTVILRDTWHVIAPYMMGHPTRPGVRVLGRILLRALRHRRQLTRAVRILLSSPGAVIDEWFESRQLKAALACFAVGGAVPLDEPLAGLIMSVMALQHGWGVRRPVGGMGAFTAALATDIRARGGSVRTGTAVAEIRLRGNSVIGVTTAKGETIDAPLVIGAIDPISLFCRLLPKDSLPEKSSRELRALQVYRSNYSVFRADVALESMPTLITSAARSRELWPSSILLAPDIDFVRRTTAGIGAGALGDQFPLWVAAPSVIDRSLVPEGSAGEGLYIFAPAVPRRLAEGIWDGSRHKVLSHCLSMLEGYAPGVRQAIIGTAARTPDDLRRFSAVHEGHLFHCDMSASQMGPWRPTPSLAGYASPVDGLWHTAAGAHPFGTVCGWPGRSTAAAVIGSR